MKVIFSLTDAGVDWCYATNKYIVNYVYVPQLDDFIPVVIVDTDVETMNSPVTYGELFGIADEYYFKEVSSDY